MSNVTEGMVAAAFGRGADARLAGLPVTANPYDEAEERQLYAAWRQGHRHMEQSWAVGVRGRWPVRELPGVEQ